MKEFYCRHTEGVVTHEECNQLKKDRGVNCRCISSDAEALEILDTYNRYFDLSDEEYERIETFISRKIKGCIEPSSKVVIVWDGDYEGIIDYGYVFAAPFANWEEGDMIFHITHPGGEREEEEQWIHMHELATNPNIKEIWLESLYELNDSEDDEYYGDEYDDEDIDS